jgi:hypothetical protein
MTSGPKQDTEFENFDAGVRKILSVSRDELKRREEQWQRERADKKRKTNPSASGRVSHARG